MPNNDAPNSFKPPGTHFWSQARLPHPLGEQPSLVAHSKKQKWRHKMKIISTWPAAWKRPQPLYECVCVWLHLFIVLYIFVCICVATKALAFLSIFVYLSAGSSKYCTRRTHWAVVTAWYCQFVHSENGQSAICSKSPERSEGKWWNGKCSHFSETLQDIEDGYAKDPRAFRRWLVWNNIDGVFRQGDRQTFFTGKASRRTRLGSY